MKLLLKKAKYIFVFVLALSYLGCEDVENLFPTVTSAFTYTINEDTGVVTFINISEDAKFYIWDFGDGDGSTEINPVKAYEESGTYTVTLKATNEAGASDTSEDDITILIVTPSEPCTEETEQSLDAADFNLTFQTDPGSAIVSDGAAYSYIDNPDFDNTVNPSCKVAEIVRDASLPFANNQILFDAKFDFNTNTGFKLKIWAPAVGTNVLLKLEDKTDSNINTEVAAVTTMANAWEELTFDFDASASGTYDKIVLFLDINTDSGATYYLDDFALNSGGNGGTCTAETSQSLGGADFNLTFQTDPGSAIVGDGATYSYIDNPDTSGINPSCKVGEIVRDPSLPFANNQIEVDAKFDFNANSGFKLKVWAPAVGTNVLLKLEDKTDSGINTEVGAVTTTANAWEELTFDFDASASGTYDKIVLFFDITTDSDATYYIDDFMLYNGGSGAPCTAETEQSLGGADFNLTFQTDPGSVIVGDGAAYAFIDNPDFDNSVNPSCKVGEIVRDASLPFANSQIEVDSKFDFTTNSGFKLKVWAPAVGTNVLVKLEDKTDSGINTEVGAVTTTANAWEELTFDFPGSESGKYDKIVLFFDITTNSGETYYIDDFALYGTGGGGGGTPATFPLDFEDGLLFFNAFEGATVAVIDNPQTTGNPSSKVLELGKPSGAPFFAGINSDPALNGPSIDLANGLAFSMKIWSPKAGINVRMRLEQEPGVTNPPAYEIFQTVANANEWVTVTFDFSTTPATSGDVYTRMVLNTDWDTDPAGGETYYIDDIVQETPSGGGGPIAPTAGPAAPTQNSADVISIFSDSYTDVPNSGFNNYGSAAFEQVDLGGNAALKYTFVAGGGGNFQVIELGGGNQIDAAAAGMTNFRFDLWFPNEVDGSSAFLMKVVDIPGAASEGAINIGASSTPAMAQGSWLSFDIPITELQANGLAGYSNIQQVVIDLVNAGEVYIDNLYFYKPGGGAGGNLAINGDFETGDLTGWTSFATDNNGTFEVTTAQANGGLYSGLVVADVDGIGSPSFPVVKQANIGIGTITPNTSVTITFDLYGSVAGAGGVVFAEFFSELSGGGTSSSEILGGGPLFPNGTWTTYSFTTTTGPDVSGGITLQLKADCGGNPGCKIDAYFDNVSVTINP